MCDEQKHNVYIRVLVPGMPRFQCFESIAQYDHRWLCYSLTTWTDMQCNCMMGVFPEISRAWLTIDNDIFMWNYEDGCVPFYSLYIYSTQSCHQHKT